MNSYVPIPDSDKIESDIPKQSCPVCGLIAASYTSDEEPSEGDVSLCSNCSAVLVFDEDLHVHLMSEEQLNELTGEEQIILECIRQLLADTNKQTRH